MNIGDSVGMITQKTKDGIKFWGLEEDKINKITITKNGTKYYTPKKFRPLDADDVDGNTEEMENMINNGIILTREVFGLNDITRPMAENWVKWANENMDKAVSILE